MTDANTWGRVRTRSTALVGECPGHHLWSPRHDGRLLCPRERVLSIGQWIAPVSIGVGAVQAPTTTDHLYDDVPEPVLATEFVLFVEDDDDLRESCVELVTIVLERRCVGVGSYKQLVALGNEVLACTAAILDINLGPSQPSGIDATSGFATRDIGGGSCFSRVTPARIHSSSTPGESAMQRSSPNRSTLRTSGRWSRECPSDDLARPGGKACVARRIRRRGSQRGGDVC